MSEIKFACPHCSQHIECDEMYCNERINCPGCGREMFVPRRAAFFSSSTGNLALELPVAAKERQLPHAAALDPWTEENWQRHEQAHGGAHRELRLLPVWILLCLPFPIAFLLAVGRARPETVILTFVLSALVAGFYWASLRNKSAVQTVIEGIAFSIAMLFVYAIVGVSVLFFGCVLILFH